MRIGKDNAARTELSNLNGGDVFNWVDNKTFYMKLSAPTPSGATAVDLDTGKYGYFAKTDRVIHRTDVYLGQ